jgi:hypothetical protein
VRIDKNRFDVVGAKSEQLQIRVTPKQKAALKRLARRAAQDVSTYVLQRALPPDRIRFEEIVRALRVNDDYRFALAELNDLLSNVARAELVDAVTVAPSEILALTPYLQNYIAAMIEQASNVRKAPPPAWIRQIPPLETPHFVTDMPGLRLYLLRSSPVPFKRRNIFIEMSIGGRV